MSPNAKAVLVAIVSATLTWFIARDNPPSATEAPKKKPGYIVMGKQFRDTAMGYSVHYDLVGDRGEVIANCEHPKTDGTGCERFKTNESYVLLPDMSGRFLIDAASPDIRLTIDTEGIWLGKDQSGDEAAPKSDK